MSFEQQINGLINEIEVPDCLSPENIALMLKQKTADKNIKPSVPAISMKSKKQAIIFRSTAAIAACIALAFGVTAYIGNNGTALPIGYIKNDGEVKEAENYSEVYKVIQDAFVKNGKVINNNKDVPYANEISPNGTNTHKPNNTSATNAEINAEINYQLSAEKVEGVYEADIVRTDGNNLYYVANNSLYTVSTANGKMTLLSKTERPNNYAVEMFINGNKLILISNNVVQIPYEVKTAETTAKVTEATTTAVTDTSPTEGTTGTNSTQTTVDSQTATSDTTTVTSLSTTSQAGTDSSVAEPTIPSTILQSNTVVEMYDITDKNAVKLLTTYKQNGTYISARMIDNSIYLVTNYSNYQAKPLQNETQLDTYVPSYFINNNKTYIDAKNIVMPSKVNSTSYSIVSGLNIQQSDNPLVSIKAVLGNVNNVYCSDGNLYVVGDLPSNKDKNSSIITRFKIASGNVVYNSNASVEGALINQISMGEYDNSFRIATTTTDSKTQKHYSNIFILGSDLKPLGSVTKLCEDQDVAVVRFDKNTAYLVTEESGNPIAVSLSDKTNPKIVEDKNATSYSVYLHKYTDTKLLGIGAEVDDKGNQTGLKLSIYDSSNPSSLKEISSVSIKDAKLSESFLDEVINRKAIMVDSEKNIIGIPTVANGDYGVKNMYYVFSFDETNGLVQKGFLEYNDVEPNADFNRGIISGDILYVFSNQRIVSAQLSDLKVIQQFKLN